MLLFQDDKRIERLNRLGDRLELLNKLVSWEDFRAELETIYVKGNPYPQGRRPYDVVLMFKILILQGLYNFSDESAEYLIVDRLSFQKFLGIEPNQSVREARTIWLFRERLKENNIHDKLFEQFNRFLDRSGYEAKGGQIVDASFAEVPRQRNTREENKHIKETGSAPEGRSEKKKAHKDVDGRKKSVESQEIESSLPGGTCFRIDASGKLWPGTDPHNRPCASEVQANHS